MNRIEIDLHIHSIYSDGTFFPEDIFNLAIQKGLKFFSITDHNCIGFDIKDSRFIPGIEISTEDKVFGFPIKGLEILGYGFDIKKMRNRIEPFREKKMAAIIKCLTNFNKFDFESNLFTKKNHRKIMLKDFFEFRCKRELTYEELDNLIKGSSPSKLDLAEFLCDNFFIFEPSLDKVYGNLPSLFKKEFANTIFDTTKIKKPTLKEAINMIKACGGVTILAHPGACAIFAKNWLSHPQKGLDPLNFIKFTVEEYGLDGIELYNYNGVMKYSKLSSDLINKYFKELSIKLGLINTWGSDCHGNKWWGQQLGSFGSTINNTLDFLKQIDKNKVTNNTKYSNKLDKRTLYNIIC